MGLVSLLQFPLPCLGIVTRTYPFCSKVCPDTLTAVLTPHVLRVPIFFCPMVPHSPSSWCWRLLSARTVVWDSTGCRSAPQAAPQPASATQPHQPCVRQRSESWRQLKVRQSQGGQRRFESVLQLLLECGDGWGQFGFCSCELKAAAKVESSKQSEKVRKKETEG